MSFQLAARHYADPRVIADAPPVDPAIVAARRAISYAVVSSAGGMSREAQDSLQGIAHRIGRMLVAPPDTHGASEHWRVIAAVALQMEARALGLDYSLPSADKPLTTD